MRTMIFLLLCCTNLFAQVKLASHSIDLKKPIENQQILTALNAATGEVFVFAADKNQVFSHKYNSALFLTDSLIMDRPDKNYSHIAGYSISESGNPEIYWASDNLDKIKVVRYVYENEVTSQLAFELAFEKEYTVASYSTNNTFYILTKIGSESKLKLYAFREGEMNAAELDLSAYTFTDSSGRNRQLGVLLTDHPITIIDQKMLNPLYLSAAKSKLYLTEKKLILTLDHDPALTQIFDIELDSYTIAGIRIAHDAQAEKADDSNSYVLEDQIYQVQLSKNSLTISSKLLSDGKVVDRHSATIDQQIPFRNSPLLSQTGDQRQRELKNTKKFFQRLRKTDLAISAYKAPDNILLTVGGVGFVQTAGNAIFSVTAGIGITLAGGGDFSAIEALESEQPQSIYFESLFSSEFEHQVGSQHLLAFDHLNQFVMNADSIQHQTVFAYKDYFILGYYDRSLNEYVMCKFVD